MTHKKSKNTMKDAKDTSCAKRGSSKPMTKNFIDIEAGIKKDKEVKEKDVFNFSYPKGASGNKNPKSVRK
jgi:hypothetical protein